MNSILQSLIFLPPMAQLMCALIDHAEVCPFSSAIGKWCLQYWKDKQSRTVCPVLRLPNVGGTSNSFVGSGATQEDAQEFLQYLLEQLNSEIHALELTFSKPVASKGDVEQSETHEKGWKTVKGKDKLKFNRQALPVGRSVLLDNLLGGTLESHIKGNAKKKDEVSVSVEHFYSLPIDICFSMSCSIEEALEWSYRKEKVVDDDHSKQLTKTTYLGKLPKILCLHLRRWAVTAEGELVKLDNTVRFGKTLVIPSSICAKEVAANQRSYRLSSVVAHRGAATAKGHYVSFLTANAANPLITSSVTEAECVLCDDARVSVVPFESIRGESSYFLLYHKI
ncbi:ubiquitin carboxyl-terminal hydrolase 10 [Angomonas deanei]|nr:ubiquitin carboxyl-terminal hydrolase 10 [Angomonas deanei]EPY41172.1 ubiquitin carboxyl-terminal hydrolase 10 [Angomonas deanei]|eukprot:EPY40866.1 ubiquitin carboxyl-terminal hydrolase 10 [Angomonas deanei]